MSTPAQLVARAKPKVAIFGTENIGTELIRMVWFSPLRERRFFDGWSLPSFIVTTGVQLIETLPFGEAGQV